MWTAQVSCRRCPDREQARTVLNDMVQNQALVRATNRLFWEFGGFLLLALCLIWLLPRPARSVNPSAAH